MLVAFFNLVWSIFNTIFRGYLIKTFWAWFVITQFPNLPHIAILPAIGFSYFVAAMTPWRGLTAADLEASRESSADDKVTLQLINSGVYTLAILLSLLGGWVVHHFM